METSGMLWEDYTAAFGFSEVFDHQPCALKALQTHN